MGNNNAYGLYGYPLGHTLSPFIHNELCRVKGIESDYKIFELPPESQDGNFEILKSQQGFNVTIPYKVDIIKYLDELSERASLFGAVNTVKSLGGNRFKGYNTDCGGFLRALDMAGIALKGNVLVCGAGGVSRMFAFETVLADCDLTIAVRDDDIHFAEKIKDEIKEKTEKDCRVILLSQADGEYDLIINGTPVGMFPRVDASVLPRETVIKAKAVFDAVYNPAETLFIKYAREGGLKYSNGLPMLVWQAALAQEIWRGLEFSGDEIKEVLKATEKELGRK